ncbi:MAG: response regulator [Oligoflexales bacterium]
MKTVLVIDDAILIRRQLKLFFEKQMGLEVVGEGADGEQAVKLYQEKTPDLITMDLIMPNKSGLEAIAEIIKFDPKARILVIRSDKTEDKITRALNLGARGFILKPLELHSDSFLEWFMEEVNDAFD